MPELPEVETIRKQLLQVLPISDLSVSCSAGLHQNILHTAIPNLDESTLQNIRRHGKWMLFSFDEDLTLLCHLGMTGAWLIGEEFSKRDHVHFILRGQHNGSPVTLCYHDPRRFGHMYWYTDTNELGQKMATLGIDLLAPEFDASYVKNSLDRMPQRAIKVALLEQKYFPGMGNYLANEVCALAGIHPERSCASLTPKEVDRVYRAIPNALHPMLNTNGLTFQGGYQDTTGTKGLGLSNLVVFHQKICQICNETPVQKISLGQRGTFFCPRCQK